MSCVDRHSCTLTYSPFFSFNAPAPTEIYTLSLHDALPICSRRIAAPTGLAGQCSPVAERGAARGPHVRRQTGDRKSTRLNSSHTVISYAVFCLKKKKK